MTRYASGKNAKAVCDRSGQVFPWVEMVVEQGTGLFVHYSETDLENNKTHPQLKVPRDLSDAMALRNPRPERKENTDALRPYIEVNNSTPLLTNRGDEILVNRTYPITAS